MLSLLLFDLIIALSTLQVSFVESLLPKNIKIFQQPGEGKGDAVRFGFENAKEDILMILDADLTMPPEELQKFYEAIKSNKGEFINGCRLVYPMEPRRLREATVRSMLRSRRIG